MKNPGNKKKEQEILGISNSIRHLKERIIKHPSPNLHTLINGEEGTGRDYVAEILYRRFEHSHPIFYKIDTYSLEDELNLLILKLDKEKKIQKKRGENPTIDSLCLYLDSIENMSEKEQNVLYRLLDRGLFLSDKKKEYSFKNIFYLFSSKPVIANKLKDNSFRPELFRILALYKLEIVPLRERREDIPILVNFFLTEFTKKYNKSLGKLADDLAQFLRTYHWPANVAQLKNLLEGMVAIASKRTLSLKELPPGFLSDAPLPGGKLQIVPGISLFEYEKNIIEINLQFVDGNREKAAKLLGISERTLYRKIKDLGL